MNLFGIRFGASNGERGQGDAAKQPPPEKPDLYSFDRKTSTQYIRLNTGTQDSLPKTARMQTGLNASETALRPMTSARAAGYSSRGRTANAAAPLFDPMNQAGRATPDKPSTAKEQTPEEIVKSMERKIWLQIQESTFAAEIGDYQLALDRAKDASHKDRQLTKQREQQQIEMPVNTDLSFSVLFNLANQYQCNYMHKEALSTYNQIVKNKAFNQSGRLRVNMGNIYFQQEKYSQAVKMYRMALDQISNSNREFRLRIMRNIGNAFVKMGHYQDAITSFEAIMEGSPDSHTGFNLILCYFAIGDVDKIKRGFQRLVSINHAAIEQSEQPPTAFKDDPIEDHEVFNQDGLREIARERKAASNRYILLAAKLVAPAIEPNFATGFDWMIEVLAASANPQMAPELEIAKSIQYLSTKEFQKAIECLKEFEKKDLNLVMTAATNLSFLYFLDNDLKNSEHYADVAINHDRYNSKAQTNKGNIYLAKGQLKKAQEQYMEVLGFDSVCTEAMYNLGLVYKRMENYEAALPWFEKLHTILKSSTDVLYQIADIYQLMGNPQQALEWFNILISLVPTDPSILARLGQMFEEQGDKSQAFQYFSESYRYYPSDMTVISWLGEYYIDCEVYEQATQYYQRAALIEPSQVKWKLMVANCFRKSGNYQVAFESYKVIHEKYPENVECLRFLVKICNDLGMSEGKDYEMKLAKIDPTFGGGLNQGSEDIFSFNTAAKEEPVPPTFQHMNIKKTPAKGSNFNIFNKGQDLFNEDVGGILPD